MVNSPCSRPRAAPGVVHGAARGLRRRPAELRRERAALPLDGACGAPIPPGAAGGHRGDAVWPGDHFWMSHDLPV